MFFISLVTAQLAKLKINHRKTFVFLSPASWTSLKTGQHGALAQIPILEIIATHEVLTMITASC